MFKVTEDIIYVGVNDHEVDLFEGQYDVPNGMSYNSYVVLDEKVAVFDTVDAHFKDEWLANLEEAFAGRTPDYLIVQHMEPDHAANIANFAEKYPEAKIVGNAKTFPMMKQFFGTDFADRQIVVKEGETLSTGKHNLTFVMAPMVHWPEVMMTYEEKEKILFSADGFGKFGTLDTKEDWDCEARRYYFNIVGKYGLQVQTLLKKVMNLDIEKICPLHGPILNENLVHYIEKYNIWSSYKAESDGVYIACASIHGNTYSACEKLKEIIEEKGISKVVLSNLSKEDWSEAIENAFRYGKIVFASSTYNMEIFTPMRNLLLNLKEKNYQNKIVGLIENGTWAPNSAKCMKEILNTMKNIDIIEPVVTIKSKLSEENCLQLYKMAEDLIKK